MRKPLLSALTIAAASALLLTSCSGTSSPANSSSSGSGSGKNYKVTMIVGVTGDDGYATDVCGAKSVAAKNNVTLDVQGPTTFAPAPQTQVLNSVIAQKPDAIIIAPTDAKALIAPIRRATAAGIKVILFDTTLDDLAGIQTVVGVDNAAGGKLAADTLAKLIDDKGKVLINNVTPGVSTTDARQTGFVDGIKAFPNVKNLGAQYNNNDVTKAASIVTSTLAANPDLAGVYATNLFSVQGTVAGLRNANKLDQVKVVGFDAAPAQVQYLKDGTVQALIAQQLNKMGATAMQATVDVLNGKSVKKSYQVGFTAVTKDSLNTPEGQAALYKSTCN